MNFLDRVFVGKSVELGVIKDKRPRKTALLAERHGRRQFVIKTSYWFLFAGSTSYDTYSPEEALKLRELLTRYEEGQHQQE